MLKAIVNGGSLLNRLRPSSTGLLEKRYSICSTLTALYLTHEGFVVPFPLRQARGWLRENMLGHVSGSCPQNAQIKSW